jgi:hypothetical protein
MAVLFDNNIVKEPLRDPWFFFPVLRVFENTKRFFNSELFFSSPQKQKNQNQELLTRSIQQWHISKIFYILKL